MITTKSLLSALVLIYSIAIEGVYSFVQQTPLFPVHYRPPTMIVKRVSKLNLENQLDPSLGNDETSLALKPFSRPSGFSKLADKLFQEADVNKNGTLDIYETYEMVLKLYVKLNRKAEIPVPSREQIRAIFAESDINSDNSVSRAEFNRLARILGRRAFVRLCAHQIITLTCAPLLAALVVRKLVGRAWLSEFAHRVLPARFAPVIISVSFWRTAMVVLFVKSLGNIVIRCVNFILNLNYTNESNKDAGGDSLAEEPNQ